MKFVAVFLACIVAAQGATYQIPSYHFWCSHSFHVLPAHRYYSYRIPFNRSWCTAAYYRDILAEFPIRHYPKGCESEDHADARITELEEKLAHSRAEIERDLFLPLTAWKKSLCEMNDEYVRVFREYYTRAYHREDVEQKAVAYAHELKLHKERAVQNFINAVHAIMHRIENFHRQLVSQFKSCLATRKTKVGLFESKLDTHATKLIKQYEIKLENLCLNKVAFVKKIFTNLYHGKELPADLEQVLAFYEGSIRERHVELFREFERKMLEAVRLIKDSYRCDYVCFIRKGCYSFARMRHTRSCVRMPCLPRTMCKMYNVKPFNLDWKGPHFKTLRTCTKAERECVWEHQPHLDEISRKHTIYTQELVLKRTSLIRQVTEWKVKAMKGLEAIIALKMPKYYNGCPPTQEQIVAFHNLLKKQAKAWVDLHHDKMMAQIETAYHKVHARIETWKSCADAHVMKIKRTFDACVATKKTKIDHYTTCLVNKRVSQRARVEKKLRECARVHLLKFDKFFASAFGTDPTNDLVKALKDHYHACVHEKVEIILRKYDDFHLLWEPRLIMHYCCGLKCKVKFTPPCMRLPPMNFCPPSIHKCVFHC